MGVSTRSQPVPAITSTSAASPARPHVLLAVTRRLACGKGMVTPANTVMPPALAGRVRRPTSAPMASSTISSISSFGSSVLRTCTSVWMPAALASPSSAITAVGDWITTSGVESQRIASPHPAKPIAVRSNNSPGLTEVTLALIPPIF
jgi:hypothetical protein